MKYVFFTFVGLLGCALVTLSLYYFGGLKAIWYVIYFLCAIAGLCLVVCAVGAMISERRKDGQRDGG